MTNKYKNNNFFHDMKALQAKQQNLKKECVVNQSCKLIEATYHDQSLDFLSEIFFLINICYLIFILYLLLTMYWGVVYYQKWEIIKI